MTTKAAFNAEDWSVVSTAPALTGLLVVSVGRGGTIRESVAISRAYAEARAAQPGELLGEVLASASSPAGGPRRVEELQQHVLETLRAAIRILDLGATPVEVNEYKRFAYGLAEAAANAHKEGSFLGVGGTRVSEREQAVLDRVVEIFDAPPAQPGQAGTRSRGRSPDGAGDRAVDARENGGGARTDRAGAGGVGEAAAGGL